MLPSRNRQGPPNPVLGVKPMSSTLSEPPFANFMFVQPKRSCSARNRLHLSQLAFRERQWKIEIGGVLGRDPNVSRDVVDDDRRILHEPEVDPDFGEHHYVGNGDAAQRHHESHTIME